MKNVTHLKIAIFTFSKFREQERGGFVVQLIK